MDRGGVTMRSILVGLALVAMAPGLGCESGLAPLSQPGDDHAAGVSVEDILYLRDAREVDEAFAGGEAMFEARDPFEAFSLVLAGQQEVWTMQVSWRSHPGGEWSEFRPLTPDWQDGANASAEVVLEEQADAIRLRGDLGLEFLRLEFAQGGHTGSHHHDADPAMTEGDDEVQRAELSRPGRWALPASTRAAGERQRVSYTDAGSRCSGGFTPGARDLGRYLVANFPGARTYQGYNCRRVRGGSSLSMHAVGRAIDVFVPLHRGAADNDLGDPIGNWLVEHAEEIGVQFIIWDRTKWNGSYSGRKDRHYGGAHPHHDHLHIELTPEGAQRRTAWFQSGGAGSSPSSSLGCYSKTLGRTVEAGGCVQMDYDACGGGSCQWARCEMGRWSCTEASSCGGDTYEHAACVGAPPAPAPVARSCHSRTLGATVDHGACVQMPYDSCGGSCQWARCEDGQWSCTEASSCGGGAAFPHAACGQQPSQPSQPSQPPPASHVTCQSATLNQTVDAGTCVQVTDIHHAQPCGWYVCDDDGSWQATSGAAACPGAAHENDSCRVTCHSSTLGRAVSQGTCVQVDPGRSPSCAWYECNGNGKWTQVSGPGSCSGDEFSHGQCR